MESVGNAISNMLDKSTYIPWNLRSTKGQKKSIRKLINFILEHTDYADKASKAISVLKQLCSELSEAPVISVFMMNRFERGIQYGAADAGVTHRVPPAWSPEGDRQYSFQQYTQDVLLWAAATDIEAPRIGPTVAMRLQGSAKIVVRELDPAILANGALIPDPNGVMVPDGLGGFIPQMVQVTGLQFLMRQLRRRYAPLDQEVQIQAISDLFNFRRHSSESTDELIARFELTIHKAENQGQVLVGEPIQAWMILSAMQIPRDKWQLLLAPTLGALPMDAAQYQQFIQYLRRHGHLTDHHRDKTIQHHYFGQQAEHWNSHGDNQESAEYQDAYNVYPTFQQDDESDIDILSSGHSNDDEPVDFSTDVQGLGPEEAGEKLYLGYRTSKRKFRRFTGQPSRSHRMRVRKQHRKGAGKGFKSRSKQAFLADGTEIWIDDSTGTIISDTYADNVDPIYTANKGSVKGAGKRRKNPIGPDGKIMKCSLCGSEDHFQKFCAKNPNRGIGGGKGQASASSTGYAAHWTQSPGVMPGQPAPMGQYFGGWVESEELECQTCSTFQASIEYADGTTESLFSTEQNEQRKSEAASNSTSGPEPKPLPKHLQKLWSFFSSFAWWNRDAFHARVRLASGKEGVLVDCGAIDNMSGDAWAKRVEKAGNEAGQGTVWSDIRELSVEGVGEGASKASSTAVLPVCLGDGTIDVFKTIVCNQSELPGLYGLNGLSANSAVIDTGNDRLIYPGPAGIKYTLSPGTKVIHMERAQSGHLMVPICEWNKAKVDTHKGRTGKSLF